MSVDNNTDTDAQPTIESDGDDDDRRPPGSGAAAVGGNDEDEPVFASDIQPNPVAEAMGEFDVELDPDQPWKAKDADARLARAKEQARTQQVRSNYGTL